MGILRKKSALDEKEISIEVMLLVNLRRVPKFTSDNFEIRKLHSFLIFIEKNLTWGFTCFDHFRIQFEINGLHKLFRKIIKIYIQFKEYT